MIFLCSFEDFKMWQVGLKTSGVTLTLLFSFTSGLYLPPNAINGSLFESYDYIVVGGGPSGLVVANRLTEDSSGASIDLPPEKSTG